MGRGRFVLKVGGIAFGLVMIVPLLAMSLHSEFELPSIVDLVWKVLVLVLLADISLKLSRNQSNKHQDPQ